MASVREDLDSFCGLIQGILASIDAEVPSAEGRLGFPARLSADVGRAPASQDLNGRKIDDQLHRVSIRSDTPSDVPQG